MRVLKVAGGLVIAAASLFVSSVGNSRVDAQADRASAPSVNWPTYGANLASHRYSPADQITKDNFNELQIAWRLKTDSLGPRPDTLYSATPLLVDRWRRRSPRSGPGGGAAAREPCRGWDSRAAPSSAC